MTTNTMFLRSKSDKPEHDQFPKERPQCWDESKQALSCESVMYVVEPDTDDEICV
jgi:hypothetical protein